MIVGQAGGDLNEQLGGGVLEQSKWAGRGGVRLV